MTDVMESTIGTGTPVVALKRRTIDSLLIAAGLVSAIVLVVAGGLLRWGHNFSTDYVHDELSSQHVYFGDADSLKAEGRDDLVKYAGKQVTTGEQAQAYASYIAHHLEGIADGKTYADLGADERAANTAVTDAKTNGASEDEVAALQAKATEITNNRNVLFKGETLRGLLLTAYAWGTMGRIAGIASMVAFLAAIAMFVLVVLGFWHHRKVATA